MLHGEISGDAPVHPKLRIYIASLKSVNLVSAPFFIVIVERQVVRRAFAVVSALFFTFVLAGRVNPDQEGVYHCPNCIIIQDPCGCDEDMECEDCAPDKQAFLLDIASFPKGGSEKTE